MKAEEATTGPAQCEGERPSNKLDPLPPTQWAGKACECGLKWKYTLSAL